MKKKKFVDWLKNPKGHEEIMAQLSAAIYHHVCDHALPVKLMAHDLAFDPAKAGAGGDGGLFVIQSMPYAYRESAVTPILNMDGEVTDEFMYEAERYIIPMRRVKSERAGRNYAALEADLKTQDREDNEVQFLATTCSESILNQIDRHCLALLSGAVLASGAQIDTDCGLPDKWSLLGLMKMLMDKKHYPSKIMMRKDDFMVLLHVRDEWPIKIELDPLGVAVTKPISDPPGDPWAVRVIKDMLAGEIWARIEGLEVVLLRDDSMIKPGQHFVICEPQGVGKTYMGNPRAALETRFGVAQWEGDMDYGANLLDIHSVAILQTDPSRLPEVDLAPKAKEDAKLNFFDWLVLKLL
jgi:hypothetical protein